MEASQIITESIDKTKVPPLQQKRILAFINHFLHSSCSFLNEFATKCEERFIVLERKMQKVEAALTIVEAKLASIPDLENESKDKGAGDAVSNVSSKSKEETSVTLETTQANATPETTTTASEETPLEVDTTDSGVKACEDERYKKFFKMVHFGVPATAVKIKMQAEGLEPDILDTPNLILADGVSA